MIEMDLETEDMAADHAKTNHERDLMTAMVMRKILASYEGIRYNRTAGWVQQSCGGFFESSIFPPFFTRGKRFLDTSFHPR